MLTTQNISEFLLTQDVDVKWYVGNMTKMSRQVRGQNVVSSICY